MKPLLRRCLQFIPVFFGITLLSFGLLYIAPSDPVSIRLTEDGTAANPEVVARMRAEMGLDEPFLVQYGTWLTHFVQGDMGKSYITDIPVAKTFSSALPYTLRMAGMAILLTLLVSLPLGISIAALRGSRFDYGIRLLTFVTNAMPNFVIAIVLMYIFSFKLGLIPVLATTKPIGMILPSATLAIVMSSRYIRQIRAAALDELDTIAQDVRVRADFLARQALEADTSSYRDNRLRQYESSRNSWGSRNGDVYVGWWTMDGHRSSYDPAATIRINPSSPGASASGVRWTGSGTSSQFSTPISELVTGYDSASSWEPPSSSSSSSSSGFSGGGYSGGGGFSGAGSSSHF